MPDPILITDSEMSGVTKTVYETYRIKVFGILTTLLAQIKKGKGGGTKNMRWGGDGVKWDLVVDMATGLTASQLGYLPPGSNEREVNPLMGIKRTYITRVVDHLTIHGTQSKEQAFISIKRKIMEALMEAGKLGQQEILHGDGTGVKALITTVTDTDTIVCQSPYGISGAGQGGLLLFPGATIAVLDASNSNAILGRSKISSVTNSGDSATVELATAISGMQTGDKIVSCTDSDTSFNNYPYGLLAALNIGGNYDDFLGVNAATYPRWNTVRMTAGTDTQSANTPDEMDVWELATRIRGRSGQDARQKPGEYILISSTGIYKALAQSFFGQRYFESSNFQDLKGGFKALSVFGMPVIDDPWMPAGSIYLLHVPSLTWVDQADFSPAVFEGGGAWRWVDGRDASAIHYKQYWNFGPLNRAPHGAITGFVDSSRYSHVI